MDSDEEIPGSCIIEGALDNTMSVGEAVKMPEEELNMVKSNYTKAEEEVINVINQLLDRVQIESAAFHSITDGRHVEEGLDREIEAKMEKETPIEQPSSSRGDSEKKVIVESFLAKLENAAVKLNRRECRALQREIEAAHGLERTSPSPLSSKPLWMRGP